MFILSKLQLFSHLCVFFSVSLESSWFEKVLEIRQVTKVGKGKKTLSYRVLIVIGNKQGTIGLGMGKDLELNTAKLKAIKNAKTKFLSILLPSSKTICKPLIGQFKKSRVFLKPRLYGNGICAGQTIRSLVELIGIENLSAKQLGSNNVLNNANATVEALKFL